MFRGRYSKPMKTQIIFLLTASLFAGPLFAHSGGTDASGCHRQNGGAVHCHGNASPSGSSDDAAVIVVVSAVVAIVAFGVGLFFVSQAMAPKTDHTLPSDPTPAALPTRPQTDFGKRAIAEYFGGKTRDGKPRVLSHQICIGAVALANKEDTEAVGWLRSRSYCHNIFTMSGWVPVKN